MRPGRRRSGAGRLAIIVLFVVLAIHRQMAGPPPAPDTPSTAIPGTRVAVCSPSGAAVFLAADDASWGEMLDAENARSAELINRLIRRGSVAMVPCGTRAIVVKASFAARLLRILDGPDSGFEGWVQAEFVKHSE